MTSEDRSFMEEPSTAEAETAPAVSSDPPQATPPPSIEVAPAPVNRVAGYFSINPAAIEPKPAIDPSAQRPVAKPTGHLMALDETGHSELTWDVRDQASVDAARQKFDELLAKRYLAFKVNDDGSKGDQIKVFDPEIEDMILIPPMTGG